MTGSLDDVGDQDADDQGGLEAFAERYEKAAEHGASVRLKRGITQLQCCVIRATNSGR